MRRCKNWLQTFGEWTLPRSEAPETFVFWTGLFNLSSALRRHVEIPKKFLGSWSVSPNLYILFVAPSGKKKSTTANYAEELVYEVSGLTRSPELITKESLLTTLVKSPDATMSILAPEFGEFIVKSGVEMYSFLTNMYDGKRHIHGSTISRGAEIADKPCLNLLGATTPDWIAANMPESVLKGGFASRVVFIYEEGVRYRKLHYNIDISHFDHLRDCLLEDIQHIATQLHGDFELPQDVQDYMENWYVTTADNIPIHMQRLEGYYERRPAHAYKIAMLLRVAYSDELELTVQDCKEAIAILEQVEQNMPKIFAVMGKNPFVADLDHIYDYIVAKGKVTKSELHRAFRHVAIPSVLDDLISGLLVTDLIKLISEGDKTYFAPNVSK